MHEIIILGALLTNAPAGANADKGVQVDVVESGGTYKCTQKTSTSKGLQVTPLDRDPKVDVQVMIPPPAGSNQAGTNQIANPGTSQYSGLEGKTVTFSVVAKTGQTVTIDSTCVGMQVRVPKTSPPDKPNPKDTSNPMPIAKANLNLARLAADARDALRDAGSASIAGFDEDKNKKEIEALSKGEHPRLRQGGRRVRVLYYLPDGTPAFPIPANLEEGEVIIVAVIVPRGSAVSVEETSCSPLVFPRVQGSVGDAIAALSEAEEAALELAGQSIKWEILRFGEFRCSESLSFDLDITTPPPPKPPKHDPNKAAPKDEGETVKRSHELGLDKVFHFSVGIGLAYDLGRPTMTSLADRPLSDMSGTEKYIAETREFGGPRMVITIGAHPGGANPNKWKVGDWFSPTLVLDPARFTKGFGLGLNFTPTPWFGILVAANMYKSTVLPEGLTGEPLGLEAGDIWTLPGDVPVVERFDAQSFGVFLGLTVTSDVFRAIVGKTNKSTSSKTKASADKSAAKPADEGSDASAG